MATFALNSVIITPVDSDLEHFLAHSGRTYRYLLETDSSQNQIRLLAAGGTPHGSIVVAESQTAGRGRLGRPWQSAAGSSLTFSLLLRPQFAPERLPLISFAAAVALREAVGVGGLKWPNDLLAPNRKKMAGILVEAAFQAEGVLAVLGIGLNIKNPVPENAAALEDYSSQTRAEVLAQFLERFETHYASLLQGSMAVLEVWRSYSYTLGQVVQVKTPQGELRGVAFALAEDGSLLVESGGKQQVISVGEVSLVGKL